MINGEQLHLLPTNTQSNDKNILTHKTATTEMKRSEEDVANQNGQQPSSFMILNILQNDNSTAEASDSNVKQFNFENIFNAFKQINSQDFTHSIKDERVSKSPEKCLSEQMDLNKNYLMQYFTTFQKQVEKTGPVDGAMNPFLTNPAIANAFMKMTSAKQFKSSFDSCNTSRSTIDNNSIRQGKTAENYFSNLDNQNRQNTSNYSSIQGKSPESNSSISCDSSGCSITGKEQSQKRPPSNSTNSVMCQKKMRKARTAFTDNQLNELETSFERQKYLSVQDRMELAARLNLSDMQVKTWYQNRRTKWKRQTAVGLELLAEAGNFAAVQRIIKTNPYWAYHPVAQSVISDMEQIAKQKTQATTNQQDTNAPHSRQNQSLDTNNNSNGDCYSSKVMNNTDIQDMKAMLQRLQALNDCHDNFSPFDQLPSRPVGESHSNLMKKEMFASKQCESLPTTEARADNGDRHSLKEKRDKYIDEEFQPSDTKRFTHPAYQFTTFYKNKENS